MEKNIKVMGFESLHNNGIKYSKYLKKCESYLIEILGTINEKKYYVKYECPNIYSYAEKFFDFKFRKTATFLELYKSSKNIPELKKQIIKGDIGYSKLDTIKNALETLSSKREILNKEKNEEMRLEVQNEIENLIEKARTSSRKKLEIISRNISPLKEESLPAPAPRYLGNNKIECTLRFSTEDYIIFEKAKNLLCEEYKENIRFEKAIKIISERLIQFKLKKGNKKAQIVVEKNKENKTIGISTRFGEIEVLTTTGCNTDASKKETKNIPQKVKDFVFKRDGGKCRICGRANNLNFHHINPKLEGGSHGKDQIILTCSSCHSLCHQNYLSIWVGEFGKIEYKFKDKNITRFTDYLFEQKRAHALNSKKLNQKVIKEDHQIFLF